MDETIHDDSEATALIKATNAGSFKTVKLLLLCGADPKQVYDSSYIAVIDTALIRVEPVVRLSVIHPRTLG